MPQPMDRMETEQGFPKWRQLTIPLRFPETQCMATLHGLKNQKLLQIASNFMQSPASGIFFIKGGRGEGKTHCLKAICTEAIELGMTCAYLPLQECRKESPEVLEGLENYDLLAFDDLQILRGALDWEDALFHLMNRIIYMTRCKVFFAASNLPQTLGLKLADLTSRLNWGHLYSLQPLTDGECIEALCQRAEGRGLQLDNRVARYLLSRLDSCKAKAFQALEKLDSASLTSKRRLTIPFVKAMLQL